MAKVVGQREAQIILDTLREWTKGTVCGRSVSAAHTEFVAAFRIAAATTYLYRGNANPYVALRGFGNDIDPDVWGEFFNRVSPAIQDEVLWMGGDVDYPDPAWCMRVTVYDEALTALHKAMTERLGIDPLVHEVVFDGAVSREEWVEANCALSEAVTALT